jgi:nucleotide-binding universal stress UspA family protein
MAGRGNSMIEKILFPTDFSDASNRAGEIAVEMAQRFDATLFVMHCIEDVIDPGGFYIQHFPVQASVFESGVPLACQDKLYEEISHKAREKLSETLPDDAFDRVKVEKIVARGPAYTTILNEAETLPADLIVISSHGRTGVVETIFGSTAEKVIKLASCPVLVVKEKRERE